MRIGLISVFCVAAWCQAEWKPIPVPPVDSAAQDPVWSVVAHNGALWATTPQGWFASRDTGRTWQSARPAGFPRNPRLAGTSLGGRLFSAAGCLFTTLPAGLYSTCDDGATWKAGDRGLSGIERLQGDADLLVAGASDDEEPFFSRDKGQTWKTAKPYMPSDMALDGVFQDGSRLWASAGYTYSSDDGGRSWQASSAPTGGASFFARQAGLLWVYGPYTPLAASADDGETWTTRDVPAPDVLGSLTSSGPVFVEGKLFTSGTFDNPGVAAGVFMSSDTGKTWIARNKGLPDYPRSPTDSILSGGSAVFALGRVLLARTHEGIYRSLDLGADWQPANAGISAAAMANLDVEDFFIVGGRPYRKMVANDQIVWYTSADSARTWTTWVPGVPDLQSLASTASTVLAFRANPDSAVPDPIYQSKDGMKTWSPLRGPWASAPSPHPAVLFASGSHIYVGGEDVDSPEGVKRNFWHSPDEGATWESDSGLAYQEAYRWRAALKNAWFRGEDWKVGVSTDSGRTWKICLSAGRVDESAIVDQILMVRIQDSLFVTADDGKTWRSTYPGKRISPAAGITAFGGRFFAATRLGLRVSRNGTDWEDAGGTGLSFREVRAIAASGDNILAATNIGLYVSKDLGAHWQASAIVLPASATPAPQPAWLGVREKSFLAGIPGQGIWISQDTGRTWTRKYNFFLTGMWAGADTLLIDAGTGSILYAPDPSAAPIAWSQQPIQGYANPSLAMADGGLYLGKADSAFVSKAPGAPWSIVELPGRGPHDFLAGDGALLAASSADGLYFRPAANMEWQAIGSGLPKDEISALCLNEGRLFAGLLSQGLWMNPALPVSLAPKVAGPLAARPSIFPGADGSPVFRVLLSGPARLRLTLHSASGRTLADLTASARPGMRELRPNLRGRGVSFYRLEVEPEAGPGPRQTFRGRLAPFR